MGTIVVGIDGSEGAARALRWAYDEAKVHGHALRAVHVQHYEPPPPLVVARAGGVVAAPSAVRVEAEQLVEQALADLPAGTVPVEGEVVLDTNTAHGLVTAALDAHLLVVGSRGLGNVAGTVLGSVSQHCVTHAHCPVVVVPHA
jgi:nucleotide-binding universal stress UspA family protein